MEYGLICPKCGEQSNVDPAFLTDDSPMPYCKECGAELIDNEAHSYKSFDDDDEEDNWHPCGKCDGHSKLIAKKVVSSHSSNTLLAAVR